jgi:OOP family OmpA-OmpF porin
MKSSKSTFFTGRRRVREHLFVVAVSALSLASTPSAFGEIGEPTQTYREGDVYRTVPDVAGDDAQVIVFRRARQPSTQRGAAHVYVDGELEGALKPGGYTRFCVKPGTHSVEAYIGDQPVYAGKANPRSHVDLQGGATYFMGAPESGAGEAVRYARADAERLLKDSREQINIVNRASQVVPCTEAPAAAVADTSPILQFRLDAEVLFAFDRSDVASITAAGRTELGKIAAQILALPPAAVARVTLFGHADPIGAAAYNLKLSEARARTVGAVLSEQGIPSALIRTIGMGSEEPIVDCPPSANRAEQIHCNAPNRRVEIRVERASPAQPDK